MKRTTITLPDDLAALLEYERRRRDVPASAIVRAALETYLTTGGQKPGEPRFSFIGIGRSGQKGRPGIAESMEEILKVEWSGDDRCTQTW
jgi:hypothetical protein